MKKDIHPQFNAEVAVICSCGNKFTSGSTHNGDIRVETCSKCHPFFTGEEKLVDAAGKVEKFKKKYNMN